MPTGRYALAAYYDCRGDKMTKELYLKPEIKSETLEPDTLLATGSGDGGYDPPSYCHGYGGYPCGPA
jgi:hypothetical protein